MLETTYEVSYVVYPKACWRLSKKKKNMEKGSMVWWEQNKFVLASTQSVMFGVKPKLLVSLRTTSPQWSTIVVASCCKDAEYRAVLDKNLSKSARECRLGQTFTFKQDYGPKHTAIATLEWLKSKNLNVLEWPIKPKPQCIGNLWEKKKKEDMKIVVYYCYLSNFAKRNRQN